jgi:hypothetical protein
METTTTPVMMLKGDSLLSHNTEWMELINRGEKTRTDMIMDAGYVYDNGKVMYTDYYTELLNSKGVIPATKRDVEDADYTNMLEEQQDLYDAIHEKFGEKWDHEEIVDFMAELDDIGITTAEELEESYEWQTDEYSAEEKFAEYYVTELLFEKIPIIVESHVDWESVWECELRYDFDTIEFDRETFFFRTI